MVRLVAASLALISLCCTPAIGLYSTRIRRTAPELSEDVNLNKVDHDIPSTDDLVNNTDVPGFSSHAPPTEETNTDSATAATPGNTAEDDGIAKMANCEPELRTVELELPKEASTYFHPTCVRLERCGGCCPSPFLTCQPTANETVTLKVQKTVIGGSSSGSDVVRTRPKRGRGKRHQTGTTTIEVQAIKHTKCSCECKVRKEDCNPAIHKYLKKDCACVCKNEDDKKKCEQQKHKYWNKNSCTCFCKRPQKCGTGKTFSQTTCQCEKEAFNLVM